MGKEMESMQAEMPIEMIETERGPSLEDQIEMKKKHLSDAKREWSNALALFKDVFGVGIEFYKPKMFEGQVVEKFKEAIQEKKRYWEAVEGDLGKLQDEFYTKSTR